MALGATVYSFDIDLADSDRGVYETLALRVARHPSESDDYLVARVLAYCLEYTEGIAFSRGGLSDADEPPITVRVALTVYACLWRCRRLRPPTPSIVMPPAAAKRVLVVTYTTGFRHSSIPIAETTLRDLGVTTGLYQTEFCRTEADVANQLTA